MTALTMDELEGLRHMDVTALKRRFGLTGRQSRTLKRGLRGELLQRQRKLAQSDHARKIAQLKKQARPSHSVGLGFSRRPDGTVYACWDGREIMPLSDWVAGKQGEMREHLGFCDRQRKGCLEMFAFVREARLKDFKFAERRIEREKYIQKCRRIAGICGIELKTVFEMAGCCQFVGWKVLKACIEFAKGRPYDAERMRRVEEFELGREWHYVDGMSDAEKRKAMQDMLASH